MGYIVSFTAAMAMALAVTWTGQQAPLGGEISDGSLPTVNVVVASGDRSQRPLAQVSWPEIVLKTVFLVLAGLFTVFCGWAASKQPKRSVRHSRGKQTVTTAFEQRQAQPSSRRAPPACKDADWSIASDPEDEDKDLEVELWKLDLAYSLGSQLGKPDDGAIQRLDASKYASIAKAVDALNRGTLVCADGICICYSNSHGMYFLLMRTDKEEDGVKIARETFNVEVKQSGTQDDVRSDLQDRVLEEAPAATPTLPQRAPAVGQPKDAELLRRRLLALPTPARRRQ